MSGFFLPDLIAPRRVIGTREFDFARHIAVMAVINRTPDSFYDQGATYALEKAVEAVDAAVADGADLVDIGGVKFSPNDGELPASEELDRVMPLIEAAMAAHPDLVISVDTFRYEVAHAALEAGASIVNDTTGLHDPRLADLVAQRPRTQLIITHSLAQPRTHYPRPTYADVAGDIAALLRARVEVALARGVRPEQIIIDPGHDLNKNTFHTLELTRRMAEITEIGYPTLAAVSNKDFVGETLDRPRGERLSGSLAAMVACAFLGARIVRMHNVRESVDAIRMTESILGWRPPSYTTHNL
ncbi:dihydropteroate synthase [Allocatelliglobosispora scoriae]|uniref:Dihydropteroate synthase n=1 Tax=Allocatelliglobosispora scoriae TaxID=643052 RepID=A0A841BL88_9ACTN|nr:dihydropteroate synthase [Allocatelliglobosispora scoriae]MBB5867631.1 dihydropteroate synthase [Allocatelliglobosispora scoriae]